MRSLHRLFGSPVVLLALLALAVPSSTATASPPVEVHADAIAGQVPAVVVHSLALTVDAAGAPRVDLLAHGLEIVGIEDVSTWSRPLIHLAVDLTASTPARVPLFLEAPAMAGPPADPLLRFFDFAHLPADLRGVSEPFHALAVQLTDTLPASAERTVALRKLLESKDAAVRAALPS